MLSVACCFRQAGACAPRRPDKRPASAAADCRAVRLKWVNGQAADGGAQGGAQGGDGLVLDLEPFSRSGQRSNLVRRRPALLLASA